MRPRRSASSCRLHVHWTKEAPGAVLRRCSHASASRSALSMPHDHVGGLNFYNRTEAIVRIGLGIVGITRGRDWVAVCETGHIRLPARVTGGIIGITRGWYL